MDAFRFSRNAFLAGLPQLKNEEQVTRCRWTNAASTATARAGEDDEQRSRRQR